MKEVMLDVQHLFCGYGRKSILCDIHFSIHQGEIVSIIGPNGSGKTTLLRAVSNVLQPRKGDILFNGQPLKTIPRRERAQQIAVVNQAVAPVYMSLEEYVLLGRMPYFRKYQLFETRQDMEISETYMRLTDTLKIRNALMSEISGGERQLASITRALVQEPDLLLLDEPTSHLDITHQARILDLIRQLNRESGLTVLMVMHDLNLASEYSDRLVLIDGTSGSVHQVGIPRDVLTHKAIEEVYQTRVLIEKNPISQKPYIILSSGMPEKRGDD